jgi:molybdopterin biosynthesis enzyme
VNILDTVQPGESIRPVGYDIKQGQRVRPFGSIRRLLLSAQLAVNSVRQVLEAGARLGPAELGLLASVGAAKVRVFPAPRVAVMSTGDELVSLAAR